MLTDIVAELGEGDSIQPIVDWCGYARLQGHKAQLSVLGIAQQVTHAAYCGCAFFGERLQKLVHILHAHDACLVFLQIMQPRE